MEYNILIVERDAGVRKSLSELFGKDDRFVFYPAASFSDALDAIENEPFDAVVSSILLDGGTVIDLILSAGDIPVIVTGNPGDEHEIAEAVKIGAAACLIRDAAGGYLELIPDVLRALADKKRASKTERAYKAAVGISNDAFCVISKAGEINTVNDQFLRLYKYNEKDVIGKNIKTLWPDNDTMREAPRNSKGEFSGKTYHVKSDGESFTANLRSSFIENSDGTIEAVVFVIQEERQAPAPSESSSEDSEFHKRVFLSSERGTFRSEMNGPIIFANPAIAKILGYNTPDELLESEVVFANCFVEPDTREKFFGLIEHRGFANDFEAKIFRKDKSVAWAKITARLVTGFDDLGIAVDCFVSDITEQKMSEEEERDYSLIDSLTGLMSRERFNDALNERCYLAHRYNQPLSLFVCQVDNYSGITARYGAAVADDVIARIGALFRNEVRLSDAAGRLSEEKIVVALPQTVEDSAAAGAERIRRRIDSMIFKNSRGFPFRVTVSFGVSEINKDIFEEKLLDFALGALAKASVTGGNKTVSMKMEPDFM